MTSLIRYLFLFLAGLLLVRLILEKLLGGKVRRNPSGARSGGSNRERPSRTIEGQTVRDPQCGMHVAQDLAIPARSHGRRLFFCSEECRDAYLEGMKPTGTDA
ncbi:MAG TPA: hypothetical protein VLV83_03885 [Acidobacteriota bacterium]|nr:hypothetical protein [Acidobacteriota bacterium]